ncbi:hypothetical protein L208DRAFT_1216024, partial [Tricholoma matsutake]
GKVSTTADGWTTNTTKAGYLGMMAHWIDVDPKTEAWTLRSEVLYATMLDNTSSNNTFCDTVESQHLYRNLLHWSAAENQMPYVHMLKPSHSCQLTLRCLEHVVNLANINVMSHITKIAVVGTTNAIWEYDPTDPGNHVLNGQLDVIGIIHTLTIKIQASGQHIQYFEKLQTECGIVTPLKITLHSN